MPAQRAKSWSVTGPRPGAKRDASSASASCARELARGGARRPLVEQHERLLPALQRPEADQRALGQPHEDVIPALSRGLDALLLEQPHDLGAGQAPVAGQLGGQEVGAALEVGLREAQLLAAASLGGLEARDDQREQPAHVLGRGEVDGAAHQPRAHDLALLRSPARRPRPCPRAAATRSPTATGRSPAPAARRAGGRRRPAARSGRAATMRWLTRRRSAIAGDAMPAG